MKADDAQPTLGHLVVGEDDGSIRELLAAGLRMSGYEVATASTGTQALLAIARERPALVILDVNLPDLDGFEVCRRLRAAGDDVPVIFLTVRAGADDVRAGFEGGADDYLTKPFSLEELTFRIEAVLRRAGRRGPRVERLQCGHVELDEAARRVWADGAEVHLTPTEYRLLHYLLVNVDHVLSRGQILDHVWSFDFRGDWRIIEPYISALRRKLAAEPHPPVLHTVRGVGYTARRPSATP